MIPKTDVNRNASNFRPASLLEIHGKMLEKKINFRLKFHLEENQFLSDPQHGFRCRRGIASATAVTYETAANTLAKGGQAYLVLRDVNGAFNNVWHSGLKHKILHLDLPFLIKKLLCDFLEDRNFRERVSHHIGQSR